MTESQNEKFMRLQLQIRNNSASAQDYISELSDWTEEIGEKDKHAKSKTNPKVTNKTLPPIRSVQLENERIEYNKGSSYVDSIKHKQKTTVTKEEVKPIDENSKDYKRDVTPMPTYYKKWDNFDIDGALNAVEKGENIGFDKTLSKTGEEITKTSKISQVYEPTSVESDLNDEERMQLEKERMLKGTSGAKPNTKIVVKGGSAPTAISNIESLKKQGNTYFASLDYEKAIDWYTKWLQMNPDDKDIKVILYSNRAQCNLNLKDYQSAERDASSALMLDREHIKSMFRYATALFKLKKYKEAKKVFNNLVMIDPKNKNGLEYLAHTEQKLSKIRMEAYDNLLSGEIVGDSTKIGTRTIKVQEFNLDQRFVEGIKNGNDLHLENSSSHEANIPRLVEEVNNESQEVSERESKTEFLSRTTIEDNKTDKAEQKGLKDFVENSNEEEELKKLQQERSKAKKNKRKKNK